MSTFMRIIDPGLAFADAVPVAVGASTPAGAPVLLAGFDDEGAGTCTLSRGLS
jgi:hypothetical protein